MTDTHIIIELSDVGRDDQGPFIRSKVTLDQQSVVIRWGIDWFTYANFQLMRQRMNELETNPWRLIGLPDQRHFVAHGSMTEWLTPSAKLIRVHVSDLFLSNLTWLCTVKRIADLHQLNWPSIPETTESADWNFPRKTPRVIMAAAVAMVACVAAMTLVITDHVLDRHRLSPSNGKPFTAVAPHSVTMPVVSAGAGLGTNRPEPASYSWDAQPQSAQPRTSDSTDPPSTSVSQATLGMVQLSSVPAGTVALSFDDGPSSYTEGILAVLKRYHVTASFFFIGNRVQYWPTAVQDVAQYGCTIGDHSETHPDLRKQSETGQLREILDGAADIHQDDPNPIVLFRPPYGAYDAKTLTILARYHMVLTLWNRDPKDWAAKTPSEVVTSVIHGNPSGGVFDLHENAVTLRALPAIIESLQGAGLKLVSLQPPTGYSGLPGSTATEKTVAVKTAS